jgi:WD40 repeat protein
MGPQARVQGFVLQPTAERRLLVLYSDGTAALHDVAERQLVRRFEHRCGGCIASARFSPDGKRLVTASSDGVVRVWVVERDAGEIQYFAAHPTHLLCR